MRIISGRLKGKSINFIKNLNTRPLKDAVKENIFNVLKHSNLINVQIKNSFVLDLYSGVGSFGIECISRGAKKIVFVEQDKYASNILKENTAKLLINEKVKIYNNQIEDILQSMADKDFDIFFLDPPFANKEFINILEMIKKNKIYKSKHIVIIHRDKRKNEDLTKYLNQILVKEYGRSKIIFGIFN